MGEFPIYDVGYANEIPGQWPGPVPRERGPFAGMHNAALDDPWRLERLMSEGEDVAPTGAERAGASNGT